MRYFTTTLLLVCVFVGVFAVGHADALVGLSPGVRAGHYNDADAFFIGADLKFDLLMFSANPSLEWAFPKKISMIRPKLRPVGLPDRDKDFL